MTHFVYIVLILVFSVLGFFAGAFLRDWVEDFDDDEEDEHERL